MKYRKKPVEIEAVQWKGTNLVEILKFMGGPLTTTLKITDSDLISLVIPTLEGDMYASLNDFIIKGVQGEFYPCKPDIFEATYERVEDEVSCHLTSDQLNEEPLKESTWDEFMEREYPIKGIHY